MTATTVPLCVDLDGTLIRTDILHEMLAGTLRDPATAVQLPLLLARGKAGFKTALADRVAIDIDSLPYHQPLLEWLRAEHANGRRLILATAAPERIANAIAAHLALFELVLATSDRHNLRGPAKADELARQFGERGFDYAGNDATDLAVWRRSGAAILVGASSTLRDQASRVTRIDREFPRNDSRSGALARALRPLQWLHNAVVFIPALAAGTLADIRVVRATGAVFLAFSAISSAAHLINDMTHLSADRRRTGDRDGSFANGTLPLACGFVAAPVLLILGLVSATLAGVPWLVVAYAGLAFLAMQRLQTWPLLGAVVLASLYLLRLYAGEAVSLHPMSPSMLALAWAAGFSVHFFTNTDPSSSR